MAEPVEPATLKAATTYNAAADHFDDGPLAFWERYGQRTVERLRLKPGSVILDVGCGSGASAIPAAIAVRPHGRVIAVDLADRLLALARAKAAAQKLENIEFRQADMEALGYPNESFDAVVCVFAIFFVPDMVRQVRELWRMVRVGGHVRPSHRRRGIGQALLSKMLRDDRSRGSKCSVLTASHAGALLYPRVGYERIGTLFMFAPRKSR